MMKKRRPFRARAPLVADAAQSLWETLAADELVVKSRGDFSRVARARAAFLNHFVNDHRVVTLLNTFVAEVEPNLRGAAQTLDALAVSRGLQHRGELFTENMTSVDADVQEIAQRHYESVVDAAVVDRCALQSLGFIIALGLRWPWLVVELLNQFEAHIVGFLTCQQITLRMRAERHAPGMQIETRPRETIADFRARLLEAVTALDQAEHAEPGRRPKRDGYIEDYASWLYRHHRRLGRETIAALATHVGKPRTTIQSGIKTAERLLNSSTLTIALPS